MVSLQSQVQEAWARNQSLPRGERWTLDQLVSESGLTGPDGAPLSRSQMLRKMSGKWMRTQDAEAIARALGISLRYDGRRAKRAA